jgi:hypothetical protein
MKKVTTVAEAEEHFASSDEAVTAAKEGLEERQVTNLNEAREYFAQEAVAN